MMATFEEEDLFAVFESKDAVESKATGSKNKADLKRSTHTNDVNKGGLNRDTVDNDGIDVGPNKRQKLEDPDLEYVSLMTGISKHYFI